MPCPRLLTSISLYMVMDHPGVCKHKVLTPVARANQRALSLHSHRARRAEVRNYGSGCNGSTTRSVGDGLVRPKMRLWDITWRGNVDNCSSIDSFTVRSATSTLLVAPLSAERVAHMSAYVCICHIR